MYKLTVKLKQHTPLIHFQHYQEGATLRASEVKPKLDRYILTKLGGDKGYKEGIKVAHSRNWLIGIPPTDKIVSDKFYALNYKLRIDSDSYVIKGMEMPMFFGDLGENDKKKHKYPVMSKNCVLTFLSMTDGLLHYINVKEEDGNKIHLLADFFFKTNFGTRQSKGYGSFYIHPEDCNYLNPDSSLYFDINLDDLTKVMEQVSWFYSSIRSGLNRKKPEFVYVNNNKQIKKDEDGFPVMKDIFYFKSLIFKYAKEKLNIQWEKKTVKEKFFLYSKNGRKGLQDQQFERNNINNKEDFPLFYTSTQKRLIKDLLGLSSSESWKSYQKENIKKYQAKVDKYGKPMQENKIYLAEKDKEVTFTRLKSPVLLKIFEIKNGYRIYVLLDSEGINIIKKEILGKYMIIENGKEGDKLRNFPLSFPASFDYNDFFNFVFSGKYFCIDSHVDKKFHDTDEFKALKNIYNQLNKNYV